MKRMIHLAVLTLILLAFHASAATVKQFMPQGRIDQQTRATALFSVPMVELGNTTAAAPFAVDCGPVKGTGHWVDPRTWSWQLERPLAPGERCDFRLLPGQVAQNDEAVTGDARYAFFAGGPWPRTIRPRPGSLIDEDQAFVIDAGGRLASGSLANGIWCEAEGVGQRIAVRPVPAAQRREILDAVDGDFGAEPLVIACTERLAPGAKMKLVWSRAVVAANGAKTDKATSFTYTVREPFRARLACEREKAGAPCSPLGNIRVEFTAPVETRLLQQMRLVTPAGVRAPKDPAADGGHREQTTRTVVFPGPLPQEAELRLELPVNAGGIKDDAGRPLENAAAFPLKLRTAALPPLAKFPGSFGIVELKEGALLPVTLRNVEAALPTAMMTPGVGGDHRLADQRLTDDAAVIETMTALAAFERQTRTVKIEREGRREETIDPYYARERAFLAGRAGVVRQELPKPGGGAAFEVVGIPLSKPGYHIVEIESRLLGTALLARPAPMYVRAAALVTNMAVHLKLGRDNALVWVTALDSGRPVAKAAVRVSTCDGALQWQGKTDAQGRALIDRPIRKVDCKEGDFIFASARHDDDYSFVRSDWNEGIEPWRFGIETWGEMSAMRIHAILDRTLLRAGQTVAMKHVARKRDSQGFAFPDAASLPARLVIRHPETGTEFSQPLTWDAQGTALSEWQVPAAAKRGRYEILYAGTPGERYNQGWGGEFHVSDFRLPVFTGRVAGVPSRQIATTKIPLALDLSFMNGGAAKGVAVEVSATLRPRWPSHPHHEGYRFDTGLDREALAAFGIDGGHEEERLVLDKQALTLDKNGAGKIEVNLPEKPGGASELYAEMRFADPNGEIQTIRGTVELAPAAITLGMRMTDWAASRGDGARATLIALDADGKPVADQAITVIAKRRIDHSHRRRIVGGFYAWENHQEYKDIGEVCRGRTDNRGLFSCAPVGKGLDEPGDILLLAQTRDARGNVARVGGSYWVTGNGDLWFTAGNQDRIDVIAEKREYRAGETARFQVRTPFREATALVSVEAGGVIETFVQPLSRFKPVIELPVKGEWAPNVFVSVLAVRGRVVPLRWYSFFQWGWREPAAWFKEWWTPAQPTAMVDLAKPAWRIGVGEIAVGADAFRLKVDVTSERHDYRPRETAQVKLKVTTADGKPAPAGTEVAFAAVDQALLELRPNDSWKLLESFVQKRGWEVETATGQAQVIGKRHFGKKALPPGGGGGRAPVRELFDTLLTWQPRVKVATDGTANVKLTMNDSLSEFRLVGVATAGPARFGTGSATVRTKQDLQMISGLPPLVREKDSFTGIITIRNGTTRAMNVIVAAKLGGKPLAKRQVQLPAEGATELAWPGTAPEGTAPLVWEFEASEEGSGKAQDRLQITQQVAPAVPLTVEQATLLRIAGHDDIAAAPPADALPGKGGIEIGLSPKLSTPPPGLTRFLANYPYVCLEQKAVVAVGLHDARRWQEVADGLPAYLDENGLARYFPGEGGGSVALTAWLLDLAALSGRALPDAARSRMVQGLTAHAEGRIKEPAWVPAWLAADPGHELTVKKLFVLQALTRAGVPAPGPTRIAAALDIEPLRLPTAALIDWYLVVKRLPDLPQRAARLAAAAQELRNRLTYTGGRLTFTTERTDYWWWMMVSGDTNAFRLIEAVMDDPAWQEDLPRLLRGALERQAHGHWATTTANAWAALVLDKFGRTFERETVTGTTHARLGAASVRHAWQGGGTDVAAEPPPPLTLPWPAANERLHLQHEGSGKPWATVQVLAARPVTAPQNFGYRITRSVKPLQEKVAGKVSRGDLWRVTLNVEAGQDMTWVVVTDPVPAGARILGDGDGRDSSLATRDEEQRARRLWPTFVERTFGFFRAYYEVAPKGAFQIDYTVRINNAGVFSLPATRVEAMYAPDVFGTSPNARVVVEP